MACSERKCCDVLLWIWYSVASRTFCLISKGTQFTHTHTHSLSLVLRFNCIFSIIDNQPIALFDAHQETIETMMERSLHETRLVTIFVCFVRGRDIHTIITEKARADGDGSRFIVHRWFCVPEQMIIERLSFAHHLYADTLGLKTHVRVVILQRPSMCAFDSCRIFSCVLNAWPWTEGGDADAAKLADLICQAFVRRAFSVCVLPVLIFSAL